jgi:hypothetical protein
MSFFFPNHQKGRGIENGGISTGSNTDKKRYYEPPDRLSSKKKKGKESK